MALQLAQQATASRCILASPTSCSFIQRVQLRPVPHRLAMAAVKGDVSAEAVVQRQLEAYNARDLEAFMDLLAEDCVATDAATGAVLGTGRAELRKRYAARFQTDVYSELLGRLCLGSVVVDREIITGLPDAGVADCLATYHCKNGKIQKMEFVWQPRMQ
ncbi:hypothetical protein COO60DRAFT_1291332 [Scenedesmus sp. NREL 46B-D3]|nr:hypothetical protein COO60DRAFT_1291332 [Scenedesmus sp. NREL 46B-D3]